MIQLYSQRNRSLPERQGIWLAINDNNGQRHTGIVLRVSLNTPALFLHLGFHHDLRCDEVTSGNWRDYYSWLECPGFDAEEQLMFAVWLESIWNANRNSVPYGITFSGTGYFDRITGMFSASATGAGLTCATFVMAVFADFELPIIEFDTWIGRDSDQGFFQMIVNALESLVAVGKATRVHVDSQIEALGKAPRFRPEEIVSAGGGYLGSPVPFVTAELLARHLLQDLLVIDSDCRTEAQPQLVA